MGLSFSRPGVRRVLSLPRKSPRLGEGLSYLHTRKRRCEIAKRIESAMARRTPTIPPMKNAGIDKKRAYSGAGSTIVIKTAVSPLEMVLEIPSPKKRMTANSIPFTPPQAVPRLSNSPLSRRPAGVTSVIPRNTLRVHHHVVHQSTTKKVNPIRVLRLCNRSPSVPFQ